MINSKQITHNLNNRTSLHTKSQMLALSPTEKEEHNLKKTLNQGKTLSMMMKKQSMKRSQVAPNKMIILT